MATFGQSHHPTPYLVGVLTVSDQEIELLRSVQLRKIKSALVRTYSDVEKNCTLQMAAALSYYFVTTLFPALIFLFPPLLPRFRSLASSTKCLT
jgi:hypothetical protein